MIRTVKVLLRRSIVLLSLTVISAHAQNRAKNDLGLLLGSTRTPGLTIVGNGGSIEVGMGITFQLTYARQLTFSDSLAWYLEFPAVAIPLQEVSNPTGATPLNYDSFFIGPALRLKFRPRGSIAPWLSAGGGYALFDESAKRRDGNHNITRGTSSGTLQFGGGIDLRTPIKVLFPIRVRAEARDFYSGKPTYNLSTSGTLQHNLVFSGGLVMSF